MIQVSFPCRLNPSSLTETARHCFLQDIFALSASPEPPLWEGAEQLPDAVLSTAEVLIPLFQAVLLQIRCPTYRVWLDGVTVDSSAAGVQATLRLTIPAYAKGLPFEALFVALQGVFQRYGERDCDPLNPGVRQAVVEVSEKITTLKTVVGLPETSLPFILNEFALRGVAVHRLHGSLMRIDGPHGPRFFNGSACDRDSVTGAAIAKHKATTTELLRQHGLPAPTSVVVKNRAHAHAVAERLGFPVVVKPVDLERSQGVTIHIETPEALDRALQRAATFKRQILVESHLPGHCHRLVAINGQFVFGFARFPLSLTGDGESTLEELYARAVRVLQCRAPHLAQIDYPTDIEFAAALNRASQPRDTVLVSGGRLELLSALQAGRGATTEVLTDQVHPDNRALAETVGRLVNLSVCGIDLITPDASISWKENGAGICEINYKPQIGRHTAHALCEFLLRNGT